MPLSEKPDRLLDELTRTQTYPPRPVTIEDPRLAAATHAISRSEVCWIAELLADRGLVRLTTHASGPGSGTIEVTQQGYIEAEERHRRAGPSGKGFVAMWFDPGMVIAWDEGFSSAIRAAGYLPIRIDQEEHVNKIDDQIVAEIRRSRFLVADFTGNRGGVYYEAGYAQGLGIPVIWSCSKAELPAVHFDVRQYNFIVWETVAELRGRLQTRIEALIGDGPHKHLQIGANTR
jgi:hypothetical protein